MENPGLKLEKIVKLSKDKRQSKMNLIVWWNNLSPVV